jgi:hypothetical protein
MVLVGDYLMSRVLGAEVGCRAFFAGVDVEVECGEEKTEPIGSVGHKKDHGYEHRLPVGRSGKYQSCRAGFPPCTKA